jgi:tetratricopeptide (TPR) repeat protein
MALKPGDIARWALAVGLPIAGGALATYGELIWGAAAVAVLAAVPPARRYAAAAAAVFGLLVLARVGAPVPARGVTAVLLGLAAIAAVAFVLALRRRRDGRVADIRWALALGAVAAVTAAGAALLVGSPTVNLVLVPLAALAALAAPAAGDRIARAAFVALVVGLTLGAVKGAAGFALTGRAEDALARGDYAAAERYASYAAALGPGGRADLVRLRAAAGSGAPWARLEAIYDGRDRFTSPRPFDAALATAALARGDYEKAAMYGDLATTPSPTSPVRDRAVPRKELYERFAAEASGPFARGWVATWGGRYDEAAAAFEEAAASDARAGLYRALALERAGRRDAAAALYEETWDYDRDNFAAAFGLLRAANYRGLRGAVWRTIRKKYPKVVVGAKLDAVDGLALTKRRLSLGRTPATFLCEGEGRRDVAVIAESYAADGLFPIVELSVNGRPARTIYLNVPGENIYEVTLDLDAERNEIGLLFTNDYADPERGVDRNVYVREVRISGDSNKR